MKDELLEVFLRPLSIPSLNDPVGSGTPVSDDHEALRFVADILGCNDDDPMTTVRVRYSSVTSEDIEPTIVPMHPTIIDQIVRPLVESKQCYVLGMPVACIAQAGLVGEMIALWRFQMLTPVVDGKQLDEERQKALFGRSFDRLGQFERVRVLKCLDSIDDETSAAFDELRLLRRQYLHFMIKEAGDIDSDARKAFALACKLVSRTLNVTFNAGRLVLPNSVRNYLRSTSGVDTSESAD